MKRPHSSFASVRSTLLASALLLPLGCATIFFPERQGQRSGKVDPNILILDGVGLLFFLIPGLIAFGVDFATGAIYLPPGVERGQGPFIRDDPAQSGKPEPEATPSETPANDPPAEEQS